MTLPATDYVGCEDGRCRHELTRAVTLSDLWSGDGPYPTVRLFAVPLAPDTASEEDEEAA
jgi:hypothetical protein